MHSQPAKVRAAFREGAEGYVSKEEGADHLLAAIRAVRRGRSFVTESMARKLDPSSGAHRSANASRHS